MSNASENIAQLMEITGISQEVAENILKICDNNLERAINYHLENEQDEGLIQPEYGSGLATEPTAGSSTTDPSTIASENASLPDLINGDDDNVRAPIPARREQLLLPEEDNFRVGVAAGGNVRKRRPLFTVCPFRDFAREAELQEQQLLGNLPEDPPSANNGDNTLPFRSSNSRRIAHRPSARGLEKRRRLEDLFRPPIDLLFCGTFQAARNHATAKNRWLIVNLQDQKEFKSQILNRDIWPEKDLKELILKYFILWQVSVENPEGLRFKTFYHCGEVPYVCIIDPRTGEENLVCNPVTPQSFRSDLLDFLNTNSYTLEPTDSGGCSSNPEPGTSSASQPKKRKISATSTATSSNPTTPKKHHASELSEEDQLALAIRNSLKETQISRNGSDAGDSSDDDNVLDEFSDNSNSCSAVASHFSKSSEDSYKNYLGTDLDSITKLQLRLPLEEQQRVQLEWPSATKLRAIRLYIVEHYPDLIKVPYKIITAFPRKDILTLDENLTLKEANLHPTSILHLHLDD